MIMRWKLVHQPEFNYDTFEDAGGAEKGSEDQALVCESGEAGRHSRLHRVSTDEKALDKYRAPTSGIRFGEF